MAENIKQKTLRLYREKKEKEKEKEELINKIKNNVEFEGDSQDDDEKVNDDNVDDEDDEDDVSTNKKLPAKNYSSPDTDDNSDTEHESDDSLLAEDEEEDEFLIQKPPYFYIDYDEGNIQLAKNSEYGTLLVKRNYGLTPELINQILSNKLFKFNKNYLIINCWKVLTKSNLNIFSFDCLDMTHKKFERKMEEKIKWGSKPFMKERLTKDEQRAFSPFREGIPEMLKSLFHYGVKIFIVSNSDFTFVTRLFEYYKLNKYIEAIFTPSICGLPSGRLTHHADSYSDRRKINKGRVFVCIERYVGRLPISN